MDTTTFNLALILAIVISITVIFGISIAVTIYYKNKEGYYDQDNNEIIDPSEREQRK